MKSLNRSVLILAILSTLSAGAYLALNASQNGFNTVVGHWPLTGLLISLAVQIGAIMTSQASFCCVKQQLPPGEMSVMRYFGWMNVGMTTLAIAYVLFPIPALWDSAVPMLLGLWLAVTSVTQLGLQLVLPLERQAAT